MGQPVTCTKEMALTYAAFFRGIAKALGTQHFQKKPNGAVLVQGAKRLEITLGPQRERRIALMVVEILDVTLEFTGYTEMEVEATLTVFDRAYQRGGG